MFDQLKMIIFSSKNNWYQSTRIINFLVDFLVVADQLAHSIQVVQGNQQDLFGANAQMHLIFHAHCHQIVEFVHAERNGEHKSLFQLNEPILVEAHDTRVGEFLEKCSHASSRVHILRFEELFEKLFVEHRMQDVGTYFCALLGTDVLSLKLGELTKGLFAV
jgi:hypothetical protein